MKHWKKILLVLVCLMLTAMTACGTAGNGQDESLVRVEKSHMTVTISSHGNIATLKEAKLSFNTGGKVDEITCSEGQSVKKGEKLVGLRTVSLELAKAQADAELTEAQLNIADAEIALSAAKLAAQTAEYELQDLRDSEDILTLAVLDAEIALESTRYNLEKTQDLYTWSDIKIAQADADEAKRYVEHATTMLGYYSPGNPGYDSWQEVLVHAQARLNTADERLAAMVAGNDSAELVIKKKQIEAAEITLAQARKDFDDLDRNVALKEIEVAAAKETVTKAELALSYAEQALELAQKSLDNAVMNLAEATIKAPFDGVVAGIYADEGDIVAAASPVIHLVDPTALELIVAVDEMDIPRVETGQKAEIHADALPDTTVSGTVSAIFPAPVNATGLVMYNVRIVPEITGTTTLKIGMRTSADIIVAEKSGVLKVPARAVSPDAQGGYTVSVRVGNRTEVKPVTVGISDGRFTEITSGLNEGETVVVR